MIPQPSPLSDAERRTLAAVAEMARAEGRTCFVARVTEEAARGPESASLDALLAAYARAERDDRFLWAAKDGGALALATGVVDEVESAGEGRFDDVRNATRDLADRMTWLGPARPTSAPTFFGGFGFESTSRGSELWKSFPAARFFLPERIVEWRADGVRRVDLARVEPGASADAIEAVWTARWAQEGRPADTNAPSIPAPFDPSLPFPDGPEYRVRSDRPHAVFCAQVEAALAAFDAGELEKVVLARSLAVHHDGTLDVASFLRRLREMYPTCTLVSMGRGDDTFLAATPELLVRVRGDEVETVALAGSAPRGRQPEEDHALGESLLASPKERREHAHVVDAIEQALGPVCHELVVPEAPVLRKLFGIQHLETPIRGRLAADTGEGPSGRRADILALVAGLHPTPAVGGVPRTSAQAWLREIEGLDRGWYAAPIGWLDLEGGGDFRVALRSGLVRNGLGTDGSASEARLFAGAGLVAGSEPAQELAETRNKLRALLAPLTEI